MIQLRIYGCDTKILLYQFCKTKKGTTIMTKLYCVLDLDIIRSKSVFDSINSAKQSSKLKFSSATTDIFNIGCKYIQVNNFKTFIILVKYEVLKIDNR